MVKTFFTQICDPFHLIRNDSESGDGLVARLASRLSAVSLLHRIDYQNAKTLAQIKLALHFP